MISFVIPHYRDGDNLSRLVDSLDREYSSLSTGDFGGGELEIIVVDDGSPDGCPEGRSSDGRRLPVSIVRGEINRGPAHSRNRGAEEAKNRWIWFLDSDVELRPGALEQMLHLLGALEGYACIVSGVGPESGTGKGFDKYKNYLEYLWQPHDRECRTIDSKSLAVKKEVFDRSGGFDTRYRQAAVEDYEFGCRLSMMGERFFHTQRVKILHRHPSFARQWKLFYRRSRDWVRLKLRQGLRFDDNGSTAGEAFLQAIHLMVLASLLAAAASPALLPLSALPTALWIACSISRLSFLRARGEGPVFLLQYFFFSCALSVPIWAGVAAGAFLHVSKGGSHASPFRP